MDKQAVIEYFDTLAPNWDSQMRDRSNAINRILSNAGIREGADILDVASGTGVMFPYYIARNAGHVTGIDISPEMAKIAGEKFRDEPKVTMLTGDVETYEFGKRFDAVIVYNAFPHFPDGKALIERLAGLLKSGGRLTIAHGFSRETINGRHKGSASPVSVGLMPAEELKTLFEERFTVDTVISDEEMYQVAGTIK